MIVVCTIDYSNTMHNLGSSAVRLVSKNEKTSAYLTAGRLDIFFVGRWGTICTEGFHSSDAVAICSILTGSTSVLGYGAVGSQSILGYLLKHQSVTCMHNNYVYIAAHKILLLIIGLIRVQVPLQYGLKTLGVTMIVLQGGITVIMMALE